MCGWWEGGAGRGVTHEQTGDGACMFGCSNVASVEENEVSSGRLVSKLTDDDGWRRLVKMHSKMDASVLPSLKLAKNKLQY